MTSAKESELDEALAMNPVLKFSYSSFTKNKIRVMWDWFWTLRWWMIALYIGVGFALFSYVSIFSEFGRIHFVYLFLPFAIGLSDFRHARIKQFAADNGFGYIRKITDGDLAAKSVFTTIGRTTKSEQVLVSDGTKSMPRFLAFDHYYLTDKQFSPTTIQVATLRVEFDKKLPRFILDDNDNGLGSFSQSKGTGLPLKYFEHLELEGDFQDHFHLYIEKGSKKHIDVLSILTPDFMQWLIDLRSTFDIEFVDNHLYIHGLGRSISEKEVLWEFLELADRLIPRVQKAIKHYQPS